MRKAIFGLAITTIMVLAFTALGFSGDTETITVKATIPNVSSLSVTISKVIGTVWTPASSVDFGTLVFDPTYNIFRAANGAYYAVDVGINSTAGSWTVTHTPFTITNGSVNLNSNINVSAVQQLSSSLQGTQLSYTSFGSSLKIFTNTQILPGWLRLYYGIASGSGDAPGVVPIGASTPAGNYQGSVVLTLAP